VPWFDKAGGRKFLVTGVGMVMGFSLALLGKLTGEFSSVLVALTGFYSAANAAATVSAHRAGLGDKQKEQDT
jgi:hypothetical protein